MNETRAEGPWHRLSVLIVLAIFGCMLAFGSGCPDPPKDEQKTEKPADTPSDGGPADDKPADDPPKDDPPADDPPKDDPPKDDPPTETPADKTTTAGSGELTGAKAAASNQYSPLDACPSPDGKTIYFTAFKKPAEDVNEPGTIGSNEGAVFSIAADGSGTAKELAAGFMNPTGLVVSPDGSTIYVADSGQVKSDDDGNDTGADALGALYTVPSAGGSKTEVSGTKGYQPKSLDVIDENGDQVYFSGVDPNDEKPGVFRVTGAGGNINVVSKDDKLQDPSGVAVAANGDVYIAETVGGSGGNSSSIYLVSNGALTEFVSGIKVGYPAGIALSQDEKFLLVSGLEPAEKTAQVYRVDLATKQYTTINKDISGNSDSAGLHRARNCDAYAWANASYPSLDDQGNPTGGGTVYLVTSKAGCP